MFQTSAWLRVDERTPATPLGHTPIQAADVDKLKVVRGMGPLTCRAVDDKLTNQRHPVRLHGSQVGADDIGLGRSSAKSIVHIPTTAETYDFVAVLTDRRDT